MRTLLCSRNARLSRSAPGRRATRSSAGRGAHDTRHRLANAAAEVGTARAPASRRQRPGVPRVLREVLRRAWLPAGVPSLGRQRRTRRCIRELQSLARTPRAWRRRRDPADLPDGARWDDPTVFGGQDHRSPGRPRRDVRRRNSPSSPTGCTTARACSFSIAWRSRCRSCRRIATGRDVLPRSTWAMTLRHPTTTATRN